MRSFVGPYSPRILRDDLLFFVAARNGIRRLAWNAAVAEEPSFLRISLQGEICPRHQTIPRSKDTSSSISARVADKNVDIESSVHPSES